MSYETKTNPEIAKEVLEEFSAKTDIEYSAVKELEAIQRYAQYRLRGFNYQITMFWEKDGIVLAIKVITREIE